jgi:hypothetical protein
MNTVAKDPNQGVPDGAHDLTQRQIRGSSLLLTGRFVSLGVNFLSQVLVVRYFSTSDYGAWAYALSVVALCQSFSSIGLDRAVTRFIPIYHEKQEYEKLFGTILLVLGSILVAGIVIVGALHFWPEQMARLINEQGNALGLLLIMIFLVPVEALDGVLIGLFASFSSPRAIFFRRYVLGPGLKLAVVVLLIALGSEVTFLAYGYLAASAVGVLIYSWVLFRGVAPTGPAGEVPSRVDQSPVARDFFLHDSLDDLRSAGGGYAGLQCCPAGLFLDHGGGSLLPCCPAVGDSQQERNEKLCAALHPRHGSPVCPRR